MRSETVTWAFDDMAAARRLWPRVKALIEKQVEDGQLKLSVADQQRVITAVVNDLLEEEKAANSGWCAPKPIEKLLKRFRKTDPALPQQVLA